MSSCSASNTATLSQVRDDSHGIDWLTVYQDHAPGLPICGQDVVLFTDPATGELRKEWVTGFMHEGSHDSALRVRCDGSRVEVSGNPSRWCKDNNVVPVASVAMGIAVFNDVLTALCLPVFEIPRQVSPKSGRFRTTGHRSPGCVLRRVDLVDQYATGCADSANRVVRYLAGVSHRGKCGQTYPGSIAWGQRSRYVSFKYYVKGTELARHAKTVDQRDRAARVESAGLIRHEVTLKSMYLARHGLDDPSAWNAATAEIIMKQYATHQRLSVSTNGYDKIYQDLTERGLKSTRASRAHQAAMCWLSGQDVRAMMSRTAWYRVAGDLRLAGVDISQPCNVTTLRHTVREIKLRRLTSTEAADLAA